MPEPLPPWREFAAGWRHVCATYDGLFLSDEEEEQARVAFHQGGARWRIFRMELAERKRDREIKARHERFEVRAAAQGSTEVRLVGDERYTRAPLKMVRSTKALRNLPRGSCVWSNSWKSASLE